MCAACEVGRSREVRLFVVSVHAINEMVVSTLYYFVDLPFLISFPKLGSGQFLCMTSFGSLFIG